MKFGTKVIIALALLANLWFVSSCNNGPKREVWLDEVYKDSCFVQDWGIPQINQSVVWTPLTVNGVVYKRGIGAHSISRMLYDLGGKAVSVSGLVGADDNNLYAGKLQFKIIGDKKELWKSGVMRKGDPVKEFNVSLSGIDKVLLLVEECGDGIMYDHADWLNVKFVTRGEITPIPAWPKPVAKEKYILTPEAPETPRINNPLVYGARPGNPFLMTIMASGNRPMTFEASGLPAGLKLDTSTGFITGKTELRGDFKVLLKAMNEKGVAEKEITLKIGDRIALTPPMGWNSWNCFGHEVSAEKVKQAARAMVESGLVNYGWTYINIDDSWQHHRDPNDRTRGGRLRDDQGNIIPNAQFPDMKGLTDYIHSLGLKVGIYSSPGPWTCGGCVGSYGYEKQDADMYGKWGFDYLKYDWCSYGGVLDRDLDKDPYSVSSLAFQGGGDSIAGRKPFKIMGDYLRQQPRDIVYNLCQYGMGDVWKWGDDVGGQCWRTTNDITDTWESVKGIALSQDRAAAWAKPGNWNDPDMLVLGIVGWGNPHQTKLKPDEQYLHFSLWSLFSAPLLIGCDLEKMDDFTLSLLTNNEVIAVNQDPLGKQATCIYSIGELRIYVKELEDGSKAVGFCNFDREKADISFRDFDKLNITGKQTVRDLWRQKDIRTLDTGRKPLPLNVPAHGVLLYKFTPVQ